jgi:hypothetical protein
MAVVTVPLKPIVEAIDDIEAAAAQVVLAASEQAGAPSGELTACRGLGRLATALWELQESRARALAIAAEIGTPPLHVVDP